MARHDYDLIVVGGGAAGLTVTAGAAQLGVKTLLVEKAPVLGGDCLHYGCVPSKTLIKSARVHHAMKHAERYGLPRVEVPPVDFARVAERIRSVIAAIQPHDSPERFQGLGAEVAFGEARFMDEHTLEVDGKRFTSRRFCVATGSEASAPPFEGLADTPYLTNKEVFSLERLPESMVVLGAGPIAMEMAQSFCRLGARVTVVQRSGQILSKEDPDMAEALLACLRAEGLDVRLNTNVVRCSGDERRVKVTVAGDDGREETLEAEKLLVALGRRACTGLGLDQAGVETTRNGLKLDARLRTTRPHIFAAGDVTGAHQFTHAAGYEGGIVISNAVFRLPRKADYSFLPWCTYTEPELASIGMNEAMAKDAGLDYEVLVEDFGHNDRALAEGETQGRIKLILSRGRPVGAQILGMAAGELVNEWVAVMGGGVKLSALAGAIHPYPTLGEINKKVAGRPIAAKLFSPTVRRILRLLFRYRG